MPLQLPVLSIAENKTLLNNIQEGSSFPVAFFINFTKSAMTSAGAYLYTTFSYQAVSFSSIIAGRASCSDNPDSGSHAFYGWQVSYASAPIFSDPANMTTPQDSGNIIDQVVSAEITANTPQRSQNTFRRFWPKSYPLRARQMVYVHAFAYNPTGSGAGLMQAAYLLFLQQTGAQI